LPRNLHEQQLVEKGVVVAVAVAVDAVDRDQEVAGTVVVDVVAVKRKKAATKSAL
jgi:thioesterase domain-containing protein